MTDHSSGVVIARGFVQNGRCSDMLNQGLEEPWCPTIRTSIAKDFSLGTPNHKSLEVSPWEHVI